MNEFEGLDLVNLRKLLVEAIVDSCGRDYALGWLSSAYAYFGATDNEKEFVIEQILDYRNRKSV
jgi:hypothetical protein